MRPVVSVIALSAILFLPGCGEKESNPTAKPEAAAESPSGPPATPEEAARRLSLLQERLAAVLESVTDAASAEAALEKLGPLAGEFGELGKSVQGMSKELSPEQDAKMKELMKPSEERLGNAMTKLMPFLQANPEIAEKFNQAMSKMSPSN